MLTLKLNNGTSVLEGLSRPQLSQLRSVLFYKKPGTYFSKHFSDGKVYLIDKKGTFSTGLLPIVYKWAADNNITLEQLDYRHRPGSTETLFSFAKPLTPYPYQTKLMATIPKRPRGTISAITGSGKSIMMAMLIQKLQLRTLVVVPNLTLKQQLTEVFTEIFGSIRRDRLMIEHIGSVDLNNAKKYDVLIVDEAHHSAAATYRKLNSTAWQGMYYRYFFTGTPLRAREEEQIVLESISGQIIHEVTYEDALAANTIVPVEAFYVDVPRHHLGIVGTSYSQVYSQIVVNNVARNNIIKTFIEALKGTSTLVLVKEIAHGEILSQLTGCHFVKGENDNNADALALFNKGSRQMIGTVGVLGEGADTRPTEWVIIAGLGKSKPAILQMVGRGLRRFEGKTSCKVLIFKDSSHRWARDHFRAQCKILEEHYGIKPMQLTLEVEDAS